MKKLMSVSTEAINQRKKAMAKSIKIENLHKRINNGFLDKTKMIIIASISYKTVSLIVKPIQMK